MPFRTRTGSTTWKTPEAESLWCKGLSALTNALKITNDQPFEIR